MKGSKRPMARARIGGVKVLRRALKRDDEKENETVY